MLNVENTETKLYFSVLLLESATKHGNTSDDTSSTHDNRDT